ncbi:FHA domain-containing protein [Iamia majanohamensis]|uniref:FHA domain-containing protein n=1 Tax=Iamia majanohamensis TaxID=467976 RepID=A0AAE9YG28_9ACTN|nr:FHA domain-containing protein [Iamia majanohamensis]WCO67151.1 FHA domain-containing protein [Iamia majanohamensis]
MSEALLTILKLCVLALLYLFFFRVLRAVWLEINPPPALERAGGSGGGGAAPTAAKTRKRGRKVPTQLTVVEPEDQRGRVIPLVDEMTVGRASGCHVAIPEDTFASQIHARIYSRDGQTWVEDLGSTNGTFVNRAKVTTATAVRRGDLVQIGHTVMELG